MAQVVPLARPATSVRAFMSRNAAKPEDHSHAERCLAAIDLAMLAAESGIMDVSVEAMRRATVKGPPVANMQLGGLLSSGTQGGAVSRGGAMYVTSSSAGQTATSSAQAKLASRLLELHEIWKKEKADPASAYEAFKSLVFPPERTSEAFAYAARPLERGKQTSYSRTQYDAEAPQPESCAAMALVEWACTAGKKDDVLAEVKNREQMPGAMAAALLVKALLIEEDTHSIDDARAFCEALASQAKLLVSDPDAVLLFGHSWKVLERLPANAPERKRLFDAILDSLGKDQNWAQNEWLVFLVARGLRDALDSGDAEQFRRYAQISNSRFDNLRSNNVDYVASQESAMYGWATQRAFSAGHLRLAADCLRMQHSLPVSHTYLQSQSDAILDPLQPVVQALLTLNRAERYSILKSLVWQMPNLGMTRCSRLNSHEQVPQVFRPAGTVVPWRDLASEQSCGASLLEWAMRDAIALGKQHEIESELKRLEDAGSDDARIAKAVYSLALNQRIDLNEFFEDAKDGGRQLQTLLGEGNQVLPLDLEILEQALAQPAHHEAGLKFLHRALEAATNQNQEVYISRLRAIELRERETPFEATHSQLAHWIVGDDVKEADYTHGHPVQTLWIKRADKTWGHQVGTNFSTLMLRYPLEGEYNVSFRVQEGKYNVGATSIAGRMIEFLQHRGRLQFWGLGHRNLTSLSTTVLQPDAFNTIRLERGEGKLTVHVNDKFSQQLDVPDGDFPFFGLASYHYRESSFDALSISGNITIPRSVEMLTPGLVGWNARFKGETLPGLAILRESKLPEEDERVDWRFSGGVLESVKRDEPEPGASANVRKYERARRESVIQYMRPLASGEEISLEFFHEPGKVSVAPALGRIAILLDRDKVDLHWITADPAGVTTGVDNANRAHDPEAQQPESVVLSPGGWNNLSLKLEGAEVVLSVNNVVVYRREWELEAGRLFGLFRDPSQFEVRVRNVRLSGPWPEQLPADLFELKPAAEVTSASRGDP
jgi:hypothetical protein